MGLNLGDLAKRLDRLAGSALTAGIARAAEGIVSDLQNAGPDWTGDFKNAWTIVPGAQEVPATIPRRPAPPGAAFPPRGNQATARVPSPFLGNSAVDGQVVATIGNRTQYREIAMDLDPDRARWKGSIPPNTAARDWYTTYLQGDGLGRRLQVEVDGQIRRLFAR
jgi:hypothetical protein